MQIYVHRNNQQIGPFTEDEIKAQLAAGTISMQDHVWWQGQKEWMPLGQTAFASAAGAPPPAVPPVPGSPVLPGSVPYVGVVAPPTSKLAVWALVCGCASLLCGIFASIPAIILGHMALSETKKNPALQGRGMAVAGTILGYVFTAFFVLYLSIFGFAMVAGIVSGMKDQQKLDTFTPAPSTTTNSDDSTTNSSDNATNSAPATTNAADQSTNAAPAATNSPDTNATNSAPSTNAPAATPMNQ